jgi:hypothetical protein
MLNSLSHGQSARPFTPAKKLFLQGSHKSLNPRFFQVDAYPAAVTFSWFFNNSEHREEIDESRFHRRKPFRRRRRRSGKIS